MKIRAQNGERKRKRKEQNGYCFVKCCFIVLYANQIKCGHLLTPLYNFQFPRNCDDYSFYLLTHCSSTCVSRPNNCLCRFGMFLILNSAPKSTNTNFHSLWFRMRKGDQWFYVPDLLINCLVWRERPRYWNDWSSQIGKTNQIMPDVWSPWHVF